jgi:probable rRNA maturation factor
VSLSLYLQVASESAALPNAEAFQLWAEAAIAKVDKSQDDCELSLRIVDEAEGLELNHQYRHQDKATNVLSFPADLPPGVDLPLLGDLVICAPVVSFEAQAQNKALMAHWAHMVVHGILHLKGYDHQDDTEANTMENLETEILTQLGYPAPYLVAD